MLRDDLKHGTKGVRSERKGTWGNSRKEGELKEWEEKGNASKKIN